MTTVNAYLNFNGNCEEAFNFYKSVFGGDFPYIGRYKDMPPMEGQPPLPESEQNKIMHVSLPISQETILMGADTVSGFGPETTVGNNIALILTVESKEEADRLYNGLSAGGTLTMPIASTFWGDYFGMWVDKFGISWMVSFEEKQG
jgi:PhnB protein